MGRSGGQLFGGCEVKCYQREGMGEKKERREGAEGDGFGHI